MADTKISALTAASVAAAGNELAINEAGTSKKLTLAQILALAYPIGSIYISTVSTNPNTLFGFGTWAAFGTGRTLVGIDAGQTEFDVVEEIGGAKTVTLDTTMIPAHTHTENVPSSASGGALKTGLDTNASGATDGGNITGSTGGGLAHNNLQPYIVVYMFKRTA